MTSTVFDARDCERIVRRLWPFLDGALSDSDRAAVAEHLASCDACQSHFDFARAFLDAVRAAGHSPTNESALQLRITTALINERFSPRA